MTTTPKLRPRTLRRTFPIALPSASPSIKATAPCHEKGAAMHKQPTPTSAPRKRASRRSPPSLRWTIVEPTLSPMLTPEEVAAANAADLARPPRAPRRPRPPQRCTVGYGYYAASNQRVPSLRLRGRWLEQLGFAIGSTLRIEVRDGELVVRVAGAD